MPLRPIFVVLFSVCMLVSAASAAPKSHGKGKQATQPASQPSDLGEGTHIQLPGKATGSFVGSGGKYLIVPLTKESTLAMIDVASARLIRILPVPSDQFVACASAEKLFVGLKDLSQIQRYDLATLKLETTVPAPEGGVVDIATCANATGPVLLCGNKRVWQMDPDKLQPTPIPSKNWGHDGDAWGPVHLRVSFDGNSAIAYGGGWAGIELYTMRSGVVSDVEAGGFANQGATISGDGQLVFGGDPFKSDLTTKVTTIDGVGFPADDVAFSLSMTRGDRKKWHLVVFPNSDPHPLLSIPGLPEYADNTRLPLFARFHLIPSQNALISITGEDQEVVVRHFDLDAKLKEQAGNYLYVRSTPPASFKPGEAYTYKIVAESKAGGVTMQLQSGPDGMTLGADEVLSWPVPKTFAQPNPTVIISINDSSNKSTFHTFTLHAASSVPPAEIATATPANGHPAHSPAPTRREHQAEPTAPDASAATASSVVKLDEPFSDFHAAAGGRDLVFFEKQAHQLAIYDTQAGKQIGKVPVDSDDALFTCGRDAIVVALPSQKVLQRFDLKTFQRTASVAIPDTRPLKKIKMGSDSDGPVFLYFGGELVALDGTTLARVPHNGGLPKGRPDWLFDYRVSADGTTLVCWDPFASPSTFTVTRLNNGQVDTITSPDSFDMANRQFTPTADGSLILYENNIFNAAARKVSADIGDYENCLPTGDPRFFIALKSKRDHSNVALCTTGTRQIIATLDHVPDIDKGNPADPRAVYLSDSQTLAIVPKSDDQIQLFSLPMRGPVASAASSGDTARSTGKPLSVISLPPLGVAVNAQYTYQIQAVPADAKVTYKLESAPAGLAVSQTGLVTWKPSERPIGGTANVVLTLTTADGHDVPYAFDIAVTRGGPNNPGLGGGAAGGGEAIVNADANHVELPGSNSQYVLCGDHALILCDDKLAIIAADGFTVQKNRTLPKKYTRIAERPGYYIALADAPKSIDVLDKTTLKVIRSRPLGFSQLIDLTMHPTEPVSYVSYVQIGDIPRHHFLIFDETSAEARTNDNWIGEWLAASPDGSFLLCGFQETYQNGNDIIDNPDRVWIVPTYGSVDSLARYDLDDHGLPAGVAHREHVGGNGVGLRLSADGKRATYLSHTGYPEMSRHLGGWDPTDLSKLPVDYATSDKTADPFDSSVAAATLDLAFHPSLPLIGCFSKNALLFFDRETGQKQDNRVGDLDLAGETIERIYFSPDGKSVLLATTNNGVHYLYHLPLRLSDDELRITKAAKSKESAIQRAPKPAAPAKGKLPSLQA